MSYKCLGCGQYVYDGEYHICGGSRTATAIYSQTIVSKEEQVEMLKIQLAEKEKEIAELKERLRPVEEIFKKYHKPDGNYGETDNPAEYINSINELAIDCWQAIKKVVRHE